MELSRTKNLVGKITVERRNIVIFHRGTLRRPPALCFVNLMCVETAQIEWHTIIGNPELKKGISQQKSGK